MENYANGLLTKALREISKRPSDENILTKSSHSIKVLETSMNELKAFIASYSFKDNAEEILFFKKIKPQLFSHLIYYNKVYNIESIRPRESVENQKIYLKLELSRLNNFFERNKELYKYHRTECNHLDQYYFLRGQSDIRLNHDSFYFESDPMFSTVFGYKISKILAHEMLSSYLNDEITKLDVVTQIINVNTPKVKLTWTGKKTELVELIYALQEAGAFNNGSANIKDLIEYFESVFNVELNDYYRTFLEIRNRKENRTSFLTKLIRVLTLRMDAADEK